MEKVVQKMNLHFWLEFRKWLDLFPASYGATPQLQLNISDISSWCRVARKKMINIDQITIGLHVRCAFIEI